MAYTKTPSFSDVRALGFDFPGARAWIDPGKMKMLAQDAALVTTPNTTVPAEILAYIDPTVIEIMTAPRRAREIFTEEKKGTWTTPYSKWRRAEYVGNVTPYSDYANGVTSDVNSDWQQREQFLYQTTITYGDLELAVSSEAKINLAADKQRAAAQIMDIAANRFYLLGVAGKDIYGILNDPNLPAAVSPISVNGVTAWKDKTTTQIYNDIRKLFAQLQAQSQGWIDQSTPLRLVISPNMNHFLGAATDFNISVMDMLNKYFRSLTIVVLPEMDTASGEVVMLIAPEATNQKTGILAFGEKLMAGRIVPGLSSFSQKFTAGTYGGVIHQPFAIAQMTGIEGE